jgi:hypothetical protein
MSATVNTPAGIPAPRSTPFISGLIEQRSDVDMVALMFGAMPKGDDKKHDAVVAEEDISNNTINDDAAKDTINDGKTNKDTTAKQTIRQDSATRINYYPEPVVKEEPDDGSQLCEVPDNDNDSCILNVCPAASKTNLYFKGKVDSLKPPTCDAATLEGARMLAALHTGR